MSWSVTASGLPGQVIEDIHKQLWAGPLADKPAGLSNDEERETVKQVEVLIDQCLETFDPARQVGVNAFGHMGFSDWDTKAGRNQLVSVSINPV